MTVTFPEFTKARGTRTVVVALDGAITGGTPGGSGGSLSLAALNAVGNVVNASCYLYGGGTVTGEQQKTTAQPRICDTVERESLGRTKYTVADFSYGYNPQADDTDPANKVKAFMTPGISIDLVERLGLPARVEDLKVGDKVSLYTNIELGVQNRVPSGAENDDSSEWSISQIGAINGDVYHDVEIVA